MALELIRDGETVAVGTTISQSPSSGRFGTLANKVLDGATFRDITPSHRLYGEVRGVEVVEVRPNSRAAASGLRPGDVILSVNREPVENLSAFEQRLEAVDGVVAVHVQRGNSRLFLVIR